MTIRTIINPCPDIITLKSIAHISKVVCNKKQERKALQRIPICITDAYHDHILDRIMRQSQIEDEGPIN